MENQILYYLSKGRDYFPAKKDVLSKRLPVSNQGLKLLVGQISVLGRFSLKMLSSGEGARYSVERYPCTYGCSQSSFLKIGRRYQ